MKPLLLVALLVRAAAVDGSITFDEVGVGRALSHESQDDALRRAREDALAKAMLGAADVFYGFSDFVSEVGGERYEAVARFLFTSNRGLLTEQSSEPPECDVKAQVLTCRLRLRGKIVFRGAVDPAFQVKASLDRQIYGPGEQVSLSVTPTKASFVYVFSCDERDNLYPVFPNRGRGKNRLEAGEALELPGDGGVAYRAVLPEGRGSARERLLVVAAEQELPAGLDKLSTLMRRLAELDRRQWTLQLAPYEIRSVPGGTPLGEQEVGR